MTDYFHRLAQKVSAAVGSPWAFFAAVGVIVVWLMLGPVFDYSDTWQLVINTFTTIVTFLMVFLIQNTQNRDAKVFHLKLDELLRAVKPARTGFVDLEDLSDDEINQIQDEFRYLREKYGDSVSSWHRTLHKRAASVAGKRAKKHRKARRSNSVSH